MAKGSQNEREKSREWSLWFSEGKREDLFWRTNSGAMATQRGKKGKTTFKVPVFNIVKISEKTLAEATELDVKLQEYLKVYFAKNKEANTEATVSAPQAAAATAKTDKAFDNSKPKEAQHSEVIDEGNDIVMNMDMPDENEF